jgi:methyl farnesoate epoxidase/farnesoate epoxidase
VEQRRFALKQLRDLGFGRKSLDSVMTEEVDDVIDKLLDSQNNTVKIESTFNTAIINVLWEIVASKRYSSPVIHMYINIPLKLVIIF